ncbi:glycoside hydrolase family 88/105 protein [Opitutus terrae]|uniref:Glycosyl hydrolase family 88 n=1 Tax=Opitutus terrae (strain DSM 11246 / JCM 15787 / PB90-1) TaxID=452637 RepID=B1ZRE2_OPITP|nr:glycoside hydrolase family 88 protein [Opitutus terrae]ACB74629.1 glycosyl hydrolase family 88 [Opitutus terrae PB90-1]
MSSFRLVLLCAGCLTLAHAQSLPASSATVTTTPTVSPEPARLAQLQSGRIAPAYPVPYEPATPEQIKSVLDRVLTYLEGASSVRVIDAATKQPVTDLAQLPAQPRLERTDFLLTSYEWGVTYAGMVQTAAATGDNRYRDYVATRLQAITTLAAHLKQQTAPADLPPRERGIALRQVIDPRSLDDSGAMAAAMIKAARAGVAPDALRPWIDNYLEFIATKQFRLADGTLARNRPMPNSLWLDDLYMSVPALAQMGALTGETKYFDDAVKQIVQFSARMFVPEKNLYRHGWVQEMDPHPAFHWARANGWAIVAMAELLDVLPENHPGREAVLQQYRAHLAGLAATQGGDGLWHQLLDRNDSYLETSASAMFVYAAARGINRGWIDAKAYGPMVTLGWNAVAQQVNAIGQVEGTCVGTGMGFDPMFYYYRPTSVFAAHGYGPVLLAGAELIALRQGKGADSVIHDGGVHFERATGR